MSDKDNNKDKEKLRTGFTTGACAAAAAKAAVQLLFGISDPEEIEIPMPGGERAVFKATETMRGARSATAGVIKDAGDDPDVTNGLLISASAYFNDKAEERITVSGGAGVGKMTLPGLAVEVGQSAINPVSTQMIKDAVNEVYDKAPHWTRPVGITISVPEGEEAAIHTLNSRLGIKGGISILGTTGIVKPLSTEAWQATITAGMDVARATGQDTIVLSSGRTSEKAALEHFGLAEQCGVMMGDHVEFTIKEAAERKFKRIIIAAQWAKMLKIAMGTPDTHVRAGALDTSKVREFLAEMNIRIPDREYNTAREIMEYLSDESALIAVCHRAAVYGRHISGRNVEDLGRFDHGITAALVSYRGEVMTQSD